MQIARFSNGGFVLHRVEGKFSCWYDDKGVMLDCQQRIIDRKRHREYERQVKQGSQTWQRLVKLGPIYLEPRA